MEALYHLSYSPVMGTGNGTTLCHPVSKPLAHDAQVAGGTDRCDGEADWHAMAADATRSITAIADRYVTELCDLEPITATFLGIHGHDHELGDLSPAGLAASEELLRRTLDSLAAATPRSDRERVARAVMQERLGLELERHEAGLPYGDLNVLASAPQALRMVFDLMTTE